jgi:4-amino-4-deoxy-L-arabinose transferase-like glycosyltransferase
MPLTTLVMAGFIKLWGDSLFVAQIPGLLAGALLPAFTYWLGRRVWPQQPSFSLFTALLIVPGAIPLYQAVAADSMALYTLLGGCALAIGAVAIEQRHAKWAGVAGLLCGLSYLTRSHGSLLPLALGLVGSVVLWRDRRCLLKLLLAGAAGYFVIVSPWWLRNQLVFGAAQPIPVLALASAVTGGEWYNYGALPSPAMLLSHGWATIINLRWNAMLHNLSVVLLLTFPYGLIGLPLLLLRRGPLFRVCATYLVLLWLGVSWLIPTSSQTGSFYHSAGVIIPWAAVGFVIAVRYLMQQQRLRLVAVALYTLVLGLVIGQSFAALSVISADTKATAEHFATISSWLRTNVPPDQPILTTQAHSLNYASGYPALSIPVAQNAGVLRQVADRYGVRYVVVTERNGQYPQALDQPAAHARLIAELAGTWVYELER